MASELGIGAQIVRFGFIFLNAFFVVLGIIDLALGIYVVVEASEYDDAESITGENVVAGGAILIVSGIITILLCGGGIIGAIFKNRPILIVYSIILTIIIILQIVSAIIGFVNADNLSDEVEENFEQAIEDYRAEEQDDYDSTAADAVDYLQEELECCGVTNYTDYIRFNLDFFCDNNTANSFQFGPPDSCRCVVAEEPDMENSTDCKLFVSTSCADLGPITFEVWTDGCLDTLEDIFEAYSIILGVIGIIFAILEIIGIVLAILLVVFITSGRTEKVV